MITNIDIGTVVHKAIEKELSRIIEEEATMAGVRTVKRVKEMAADIAVEVSRKFNVEVLGQTLKITVNFGENAKKG